MLQDASGGFTQLLKMRKVVKDVLDVDPDFSEDTYEGVLGLVGVLVLLQVAEALAELTDKVQKLTSLAVDVLVYLIFLNFVFTEFILLLLDPTYLLAKWRNNLLDDVFHEQCLLASVFILADKRRQPLKNLHVALIALPVLNIGWHDSLNDLTSMGRYV